MAPLIVYLLSIYSDGIAIARQNATERINTLGDLLKGQINEEGQSPDVSKIIESSNEKLRDAKKESKRKLNLLNPKRQIYRIFSPLTLALFFIMLDKLFKDENVGCSNNILSVTLLFLSATCFIIGIFILKQVAWVVIDTKEEINKKTKKEEPLESQGNK